MTFPSVFSTDLAIDLGTANTCVFAQGRGIVLNEPSIVAFNTVRGEVEAVGQDAHEMLGRTPSNIQAVRPLKDGVIADFDAAEKMLVHFVKKAMGSSRWKRPRLIIGVPSEITQVERRAVRDSGFRVKASEVHLVDEPMAAAIGAGLPITEAAGNMVIDIGGGTTDIAVISMAGTVYGRSLRVAGDAMDDAIMTYLRKSFNLHIGERTAQQIKFEIGSAMPLDEPLRMDVKGRHVVEGVPRTVTVSDADIRTALAEPLRQIVIAVRESLERIPPELCADIYDRGVVLTGGGALLRNLDKRLRDETGLPVLVAENPLTSVVTGAGMMLTDMALLRKVSTN
ncbi:MAG TPA: rod shape-determining protein [Vicinamibacterales bacterium]|jgi:rod shape-determining protein MreB